MCLVVGGWGVEVSVNRSQAQVAAACARSVTFALACSVSFWYFVRILLVFFLVFSLAYCLCTIMYTFALVFLWHIEYLLAIYGILLVFSSIFLVFS